MKYAFLDADFVIKAHTIRKNDQNLLIDQILNKEGYQFYCHQQTLDEIKRHNKTAYEWYNEQIRKKRVYLYTDEQIIRELIDQYMNTGFGIYSYTDLLKNACSCFSGDYYFVHFGELDQLDYNQLEPEEYCKQLQKLDVAIGQGKNLGEIKTYVLMSWLSIKSGESLLFFCSDDNGARQGTLSIKSTSIQCFTIMSIFYWLQKEDGFDREAAEPYLQSMIQFNKKAGANTARVRKNIKGNQIIRLDIETIIEDLYRGQFGLSPDGYLTY